MGTVKTHLHKQTRTLSMENQYIISKKNNERQILANSIEKKILQRFGGKQVDSQLQAPTFYLSLLILICSTM